MGTPKYGPFHDFGERRGDATSAAFIDTVNRELFSIGQTGAGPNLESFSGPFGVQIALNRATLDLRRFRLTADMTAGGSAAAVILCYNASEGLWNVEADAFTVYDAFGPTTSAVVMKAGDKGLAKLHPDSGLWELVNAPPGTGFTPDFFPAKVTSHTTVSTKQTYAWTEQEFATLAADGTALSGGRSGTASDWPAYELNNRVVADNTYVWMRLGFEADPATVTITTTATGNGLATGSAWSMYLADATGGTFTLTLAGRLMGSPVDPGFQQSTTTALAYNASGATVKTALESATGLTFSSFSGAGTLASPWTFSVSSNAEPYFLTADATGLHDGSDFRFAAPDGSVGVYTWTAIKTADYSASVWEAIPVQPSVTQTLSVTDATNATPIVITTSANEFADGDTVTISGVTGNTAANGTWVINRLTSTTFELNGSVGNGTFGGIAFAAASGPIITLPDWTDSPENSRVLIAVMSDTAPYHISFVAPESGDKILGSTSTWNLTDPSTAYATYGSWSGQTYEFIRSNSSSVGWTCSNSRGT